ncbi:MAG: hypothetical protein M3340_12970 [Actinomycetota bacterium]|nr:hypothetical protein [Actinomycetota bacterium]
MARGPVTAAVILALLAAASPAAAQAPCTADFPATAPPPQPGAKLRFGIYPGGPAGQLGPVPAPAVPEDQGKIFAALEQLRPPAGPFAVHVYRAYMTPESEAREEQEHRRLVDLYTARGYAVEIVIRYRRDNDPGGFAEFVRGVVRRFGANPLVKGFQVTNEVNFTASPDSSDGAYAGSRDALIQGVIAAKEEARARGYSHVQIGFNWVYRTDPANERQFWEYLGSVGGERFVKSLDWVGLDAYPGTFFPPRTEPSTTGDILVHAMSTLRKCSMPMANIPDSVPIHIEENGYPTGPDRSYEDQRVAAERMLDALDQYARVYGVTDYFWFDLRDADSSSPNFQQQYGVMRDDYTPKPAFEVLRDRFARMTVPGSVTPPSAAPPAPRSLRVKLRLRCFSRGVTAYLIGSDAASASSVRFALRGKRIADRTAPFRGRVRLRASRRSYRVRAVALIRYGSAKPVTRVKHARCAVRR